MNFIKEVYNFFAETFRYTRSIGAEHFETSAKDNVGVTQVFDYLVKGICIINSDFLILPNNAV